MKYLLLLITFLSACQIATKAPAASTTVSFAGIALDGGTITIVGHSRSSGYFYFLVDRGHSRDDSEPLFNGDRREIAVAGTTDLIDNTSEFLEVVADLSLWFLEQSGGRRVSEYFESISIGGDSLVEEDAMALSVGVLIEEFCANRIFRWHHSGKSDHEFCEAI